MDKEKHIEKVALLGEMHLIVDSYKKPLFAMRFSKCGKEIFLEGSYPGRMVPIEEAREILSQMTELLNDESR